MTNTITFVPQPSWFRALNRIWRSTYPIGTRIRLDKEDLISRARKSTGLTDFGKDPWEEPLDRMLEAMNHEARLSPVGCFISRQRLINLLGIRLRAQAYFSRFPEILEQELYPAWIIVGLQRTGTTKLQRMFSADPNHRCIPSWEAINPVPHADPDRFTREPHYPPAGDKRIRIAQTSVNAVKWMSPGFFAVHPLDALLPEEDVLLLDVSFMSTTTEAMMEVPSYTSWLESTDQTTAYVYYVKLLKLMQWLRPAKRWILKSPHHLEFPDLITKCMNEVTFIWPHRSIYESIPSFLSMLTYNHMLFSESVDPQSIARRWIRKSGYALDKALAFRQHPENSKLFVDMRYGKLIQDAIGELDQVYKRDGGLTPELLQRFRQHEAEHPYRKHGKHAYSLKDFHVTEQDIDRCTTNYQQFLQQYDLIPAAKI